MDTVNDSTFRDSLDLTSTQAPTGAVQIFYIAEYFQPFQTLNKPSVWTLHYGFGGSLPSILDSHQPSGVLSTTYRWFKPDGYAAG
ncbi:hypothetical protein RRG08_002531 [Elysia crispata]|uniref:Uncharacterized protein n=1 Tax=Elysia crispata TaxID=231223 RepID=A0AAE1B549_9GAST|nr:hypothetical protein RRG08_002531 [Elysia crispata]